LMKRHQQEIATPDNNNIDTVRSHKPIFGTTKWLTYAAVFTALAIVMKFLGQLLTLTDSFKITPIYAVWLIAAATLGPIGGGAVCGLSDLIGAIVIPQGAINPLLNLGCIMYGVIAGLCFKLPTRTNLSRFVIAGVLCTVFVTLIFDSFAIWVWCKYYLKLASWADRALSVYIASRALQCAVGAINIAITVMLLPLLNKLKLLPATRKKRSLSI